MNKFIGIGRLTKDPNVTYSQGAETMCIARYTLAVDRKGDSEVVTVGKGDIRLCDDGMFPADVLHRYGYECVSGGRTDVVALKERGLQTPCCNIGCGYYNAHKPDEYTIFTHLEKALAFVGELLEKIV